MPSSEATSTILKAIFCCACLKTRTEILSDADYEVVREGTTTDIPSGPPTDSTLHIIPPPEEGEPSPSEAGEVTPTPAQYHTAHVELQASTSNPVTPRAPASHSPPPLTQPASSSLVSSGAEQSESLSAPLVNPSPKMFSPNTLYKLSQCHDDILDLKSILAASPCVPTYRGILPQIYEVLLRDEVIYLFTNGAEDATSVRERLRFCDEILDVAYWDVDSGGDGRLAGWVERGLGGVVEANPTNILALMLLGRSWLLKSQQYLSKISDDGSTSSSSGGSFPFTNTDWTSADEDRDTAEQDRKRQEGVYVDARTCLFPAVEFLGRAVDVMEAYGQEEGEVYVLQAEANMSLGNVTVSSEAQEYFRNAVEALKKASLIDGFRLPGHLERYLRSFEFVLYD
ncbi:hypothetical protein H072_883 [Dactylellina haptotyla CBS 200.50]|uniref:Uncharacterized protein n=1 Tax=Dactylellina haptotyla (strain CBS 200.50) TaxID=1284197 RepID=S8C047_DACHA|nr:hypothetical protein H072_883 [Dactylellina haptotyla CBS 200.50]